MGEALQGPGHTFLTEEVNQTGYGSPVTYSFRKDLNSEGATSQDPRSRDLLRRFSRDKVHLEQS